jgi:hypothetical protein
MAVDIPGLPGDAKLGLEYFLHHWQWLDIA